MYVTICLRYVENRVKGVLGSCIHIVLDTIQHSIWDVDTLLDYLPQLLVKVVT